MARRKTLRIAQFNGLPNCKNNDESLRGKWKEYFQNDQPIVLELGCGKADLSVGLARLRPHVNYVAVDVKSPRMWVGAQTALDEGLKNIAFLRAEISALSLYFAPDEVSGIWITFPDPFPRKKGAKRRLTHERFLREYMKILKQKSLIQFKTDNADLFQWTLEHYEELNASGNWEIAVSDQTTDLHHSPLKSEETGITTDYERRFLAEGIPIKYMRYEVVKFPPPSALVPEMEKEAEQE